MKTIPKLGEKEFKILHLIKKKKSQKEISIIFKETQASISKIFKKFIETGLITKEGKKEYLLTKNGVYFLNLYYKIR